MDSLDNLRGQTARARNAESALKNSPRDRRKKIERASEVPQSLSLSEIFADAEKQLLFSKLLNERGPDIAAEIRRKQAEKVALTPGELGFLTTEATEFTNLLKHAETFEKAATPEMIAHLASLNERLRAFAGMFQPDRAAELSKSQIRVLAMEHPDSMRDAVKAITTLEKLKEKKNYKAVLAEHERIKRRYELSDEELAEVDQHTTQRDRTLAMREIYKKRLKGFHKAVDTASSLRLQFNLRGGAPIQFVRGESLSERKALRASVYFDWNQKSEVLKEVKKQEKIIGDMLAIATTGDSEFIEAATREVFNDEPVSARRQEEVSTREEMKQRSETFAADKFPEMYRAGREHLSGELYNKTFHQLDPNERAHLQQEFISRVEAKYKVRGRGYLAMLINLIFSREIAKVRSNPAHYLPNDPRPPKGKRNKNRNRNQNNNR